VEIHWLQGVFSRSAPAGLPDPLLVASDGAPGVIRAIGEERRRTNVIPHAFGERAVLKLV